ncbi:hypothetical protein [Synechococcus phage BUCT-ZZ01]|nr:hypothetical protein [Synechococcus phage BUCT-ZZ01]
MHKMTYKFKYSFTELQDMIPWERDVYASMVAADIAKEAAKEQQ